MDEIFVEKFCSICGKISWDSQTGSYNETHVKIVRKTVPCNNIGTRAETDMKTSITTYFYVDGSVKKYDADGKEMEV